MGEVTPDHAATRAEAGVVETARDVLLRGYAEELVGTYGGEPRHPSTQRRYERDVAAFTEDVDALIAAVRAEGRAQLAAARTLMREALPYVEIQGATNRSQGLFTHAKRAEALAARLREDVT